MKYDVHAYPQVRIKIEDVEANSQKEAIAIVEKMDFHHLLRPLEWAEEISWYLVDEHGDEEYEQSQSYEYVAGELRVTP